MSELRAQLREQLTKWFEEEDQLKRLVADHFEPLKGRISWDAPLETQAETFIGLLAQEGRIPALWPVLEKTRPVYASDIERLAKLWSDADLSSRAIPYTAGPVSGWRPSRNWQLKHLERLEDGLGNLSPATPPRGTRQEWPLSKVFVPLDLHSPSGQFTGAEIDWSRVIKTDRVVLTGAAGAGKSTLLRHLVLTAAKRRRDRLARDSISEVEEPSDLLSRIPLWINLPMAAGEIQQARDVAWRATDDNRRATKGEVTKPRWFKNLVAKDWIYPVASAAHLRSHEDARGLLDSGEILLVFDGLDEIADFQCRHALIESLAKLPRAFGSLGAKNPVVVGCRDKAWERGGPFAPFEEIQVQPMDRPKWEEYLTRWCRAVWEEDADEVLNSLKRALRTSRAVQDMAANPQTATMLAVLARDGELSQQRVRLYDDLLRCALKNERLDKYGNESEIREHLIALAVDLQTGSSSTGELTDSLSENRAQSILGARLVPEGEKDLDERETRERGKPLLEDIELHTGLISIDRTAGPKSSRTVVRFRHRTVQEFLVACHYSDHPQAILAHIGEPAWLVPIAFTSGLLANDSNALKDFLRQLSQRRVLDSGQGKEELLGWCKRVAVLSACLEELPTSELPEGTLAPVKEAYEGIGKELEDLDLVSRVAIAEGMGILGDPRLVRAHANRWVEIAACSSLVGSNSDEAWIQERPAHQVSLSQYWIQRWPVTVAEYACFVEDASGYKDNQWWDEACAGWRKQQCIEMPEGWERSRAFGNRPVTGVSWWEARAYTRWLTSVERLPEDWAVTLPTEAQWERAARGPLDSPTHIADRFPWGAQWDQKIQRANCRQVLSRVCPVGVFPRGHSAEGIWDLAGNVGERCLDGFGPPDSSESMDPCHVDYRFGHSVRGGDYSSPILNARVSARFADSQFERSHRIGFRCAAWSAPKALR